MHYEAKTAFVKRRRQYEEERERGWMQTMSGHVGKISLFSQLLPKKGRRRYQEVENEKLPLSSKNHVTISCSTWEGKRR